MNKDRILSAFPAAVVVAVTVMIAACGGGGAGPSPVPAETYPVGAGTSGDEAAQAEAGDTIPAASWRTVSLDFGVIDLDVDHESGRMYVLSAQSVFVVDSATGKAAAEVPLTLPPEVTPRRMAVNPAASRIYVTAVGDMGLDGRVLVLDGDSAKVISEIGGEYSRMGGVAVNSTTNRVYVVAESETHNPPEAVTEWERILLVIDGKTNRIVSTIPGVGRTPGEVAVNPTTNRVYVSDPEADKVYVVDGDANSVMTMVTAGDSPSELYVNAAANRIYAVNRGDASSISVIDGKSNGVVDTIEFDNRTCGVSVDQDEGRTYVMGLTFALEREVEVARVIEAESGSIVADYDKLPSCAWFTIDPRNHRAYTVDRSVDGAKWFLNIVDFQPGAVSTSPPISQGTEMPSQELAGFGVVATVHVGGGPTDIAINEKTNRIFVANRDSRELSFIDGKSNTVVVTVPLEGVPYFVAVNPNSNRVYVNGNYGEISVFDGDSGSRLTTVPGAFGTDAAVNSISNRIYLVFSNGSRGDLYVIDGNTDSLMTSVSVGEGASAVAVDAEANRVYVVDEYANSVLVLDGTTNSVVTTIRLSGFGYPKAIAVDPLAKRAYVESMEGVGVIDTRTDTLITTLENAGSVAIDPERGLLFTMGAEGVSIVDRDSEQVIASVALDGMPIPDRLAINTTTGHLYFTDQERNIVVVMD